MPIQLIEHEKEKFLEMAVSGKLTDEDYQHFVNVFDRVAKQYGKFRVLVRMSDFHGWDVKAAWDDIKFGVKYHHDIERLAMIGEKKWQQWMSSFCKLFTTGETRYFDAADAVKARAWIEEGTSTSMPK